MNRRLLFFSLILFASLFGKTQSYPQYFFRHPLDIPMQLVANFGEIRTNHWHMGLDIRTQQKVNLPVYASADGYISRVSVEPGGFGQAIYVDHPNGYTTVYGHLNSFYQALAGYVKQKQYELESWRVNLILPEKLFVVKKGQLIGLSGSTGASEGPHVHFEIRDTKTENCLNPLLFRFPIADGVPPTLTRLAMYDRNRSTWEQSPQILSLRKIGAVHTIPGSSVRVGSDKISFAIGAVDRFSRTPNPNGIFSAKIIMDGKPISGFVHDDISYNDTRYINAQLDFPFKTRGGGALQHISPLPGARAVAYALYNEDGVIHLPDNEPHLLVIEVKDATGNTSKIQFTIQYDERLRRSYTASGEQRFLPNNVNIFERDHFELFTTERTVYDTITVAFNEAEKNATDAVSNLFTFFSSAIPSHDSITVRIKTTENIPAEWRDKIIIKNISGTRTFISKARWQNGWYSAKFRQFGSYQAFIDNEPPTINSPLTNLSKATRIIFTPKDNFNVIKNFRVELNGKWLRFTNDKGRTWIYTFDEHFPRGNHELNVIVEDEAGNITTKSWAVTR